MVQKLHSPLGIWSRSRCDWHMIYFWDFSYSKLVEIELEMFLGTISILLLIIKTCVFFDIVLLILWDSIDCIWNYILVPREVHFTKRIVLYFSVWYCLSDMHFRYAAFVVQVKGNKTFYLLIYLDRSIASIGICLSRPLSTEIFRSQQNTWNILHHSLMFIRTIFPWSRQFYM